MHCQICGKGTMQRNSVSHAKNTFVRYAKPNVKRMRLHSGGRNRLTWVCTKCLKRGSLTIALPRRLSRPAATTA